MVSFPGSGRSLGKVYSNTLQYYCLENPWTEELGGLQSIDCKESNMTQVTEHNYFLNIFVYGRHLVTLNSIQIILNFSRFLSFKEEPSSSLLTLKLVWDLWSAE